MTCNECRRLLVDYVDGHLANAGIEAHLAQCACCRAQAARERRLSGLLQGTLAAAPTAQRLILPARPAPRGRRRAAVVAAALACLLMAVVYWRSTPAPPRQTVASRDAKQLAAKLREPPLDGFEAELAREAIAARLAASAESLAAEPATNQYAAKALQFVAEAFPETHAGRKAARGAGLIHSHAKEEL